MLSLWTTAFLLCPTFLTSTLAFSTGWYYYWPPVTTQCRTADIYIYGGTPPWSIALVPINGSPIIWKTGIPSFKANLSNPAIYSIPVEFAAGTAYTVVMADENGYNGDPDLPNLAANPREIQIVQPSIPANDTCLNNVTTVPHEFNFAISGKAVECQTGFQVKWWDGLGRAPYYMTIIPLDTSYYPWEVSLSGGAASESIPDNFWVVNMTRGTRFTVVMSSVDGWGVGGVGGIYEVSAGNSQSCLNVASGQTHRPTASWPANLVTTSLLPSTTVAHLVSTTSGSGGSQVAVNPSMGSADPSLPISSGSSASSAGADSSGNTKQGSSLGTGAIAGIAVGAVAVVAIIGGILLWWCLKKRKGGYKATPQNNMDLVDGESRGGYTDTGTPGTPGLGQVEPKIEPFRSGYDNHQLYQDGTTGSPEALSPGSQRDMSMAAGGGILGAAGAAGAVGYADSHGDQRRSTTGDSVTSGSVAPNPHPQPHRESSGSMAFPVPQPSSPSAAGSATGGRPLPSIPGQPTTSTSSSSSATSPFGAAATTVVGTSMAGSEYSGGGDRKSTYQPLPHHSNSGSSAGVGGVESTADNGYGYNDQQMSSPRDYIIHEDLEAPNEVGGGGGAIELPPRYENVPRRDGPAGQS